MHQQEDVLNFQCYKFVSLCVWVTVYLSSSSPIIITSCITMGTTALNSCPCVVIGGAPFVLFVSWRGICNNHTAWLHWNQYLVSVEALKLYDMKLLTLALLRSSSLSDSACVRISWFFVCSMYILYKHTTYTSIVHAHPRHNYYINFGKIDLHISWIPNGTLLPIDIVCLMNI